MTAIRHELNVQATGADILKALTTAEGIRAWWAKDADIGKDNHELRFDKDGNVVTMKFRVDHVTDEEVKWTCTENANPVWPGTTLVWRWSRKDEKTLLSFEHSGFSESESPPYQMTVQGWTHFVESLRRYLDDGSGQAW